MKFFLIKTGVLLLIIFIILIVINLLGDPANLFNDYHKKMMNILEKDSIVTNISNYDERLLQKQIIEYHKNIKIDIAVIGSSRVMLLNSTILNTHHFINNSVSGATLEDLIAIFQLYKNNNIKPEIIIIGIDPWIFNANNKQNRWKSLTKEYNEFRNIHLSYSFDFFKYKELVSLSYFKNSIKNIPNKFKPKSTKKIINITNTKFLDGSVKYAKKIIERTQKEIDERAFLYIKNKKPYIENFEKISEPLWLKFDLLCNKINNNSKLVFFLPPYHPFVYNCLESNNNYKMILEVENRIKLLAKSKNIELIGSFNPFMLNLKNKDFYDQMHCKEEAIIKILNNPFFKVKK